MTTLQGRVALITGAQQGIGRAIAEAAGREGASVVVQYLDDRDAAEQVGDAVESFGSEARVVPSLRASSTQRNLVKILVG